MLEALRLRELLSYDPDTGLFRWSKNKGSKDAGELAGCVSPKGYILIGIDGCLYLAHRLAWLYVHGEFPEKDIDHRDQDKSNNRICNLRLATSS